MAVVTELTIDSSGAERGSIAFANAMAMAARASNDNLKSIADNTAALRGDIAGLGETTRKAAEDSSFSFGSFAAKVALSVAATAVGLGALYAAFKVFYEIVTFVPRALSEAWDLGTQKLADYVKLGKEAAELNVSTDFLQRIRKGADEATISLDGVNAALKRIAESTQLQLGGSEASQRLEVLTKAGNFAGNAGTGQLRGANDSEESLRAFANFWHQALGDGERLAALDFAKTFGGAEFAANLAKNAAYVDDLVEKADAIRQKDLISGDDVLRAQQLQDRLDAAEKILSQRWHPIQDVLTELGIKMREAWVGIVEAAAAAFDWVAKIAEKLAGIPSAFWTILGAGVTAGAAGGPLGALFGVASSIGAAGIVGALAPDGAAGAGGPNATAAQMADARRRLATGLNRQFDRSKDPNAEKDEPDTSAYDRAEEALRKYIETTNAATKSIDDTTAAQERGKAMAQLVAAGMKDGLSREAATAKAEMSGLAVAAGQAADALAHARITSQINFGRNTGLLSQDDVAIAQQLKGLYPDVATALASVEAQGIRTNNAMKSLSSAIETNLTSGLTDIVTGTKKASDAFRDMGNAIIKAIDEMIIKLLIVQPLMRALQGAAGSIIPVPGITGHAHGDVFVSGNVVPFAQGGIVDSPTLAPMALFGESGPEAIVPLKRGADGNLGIASQGGGGGDTHIYNIDARGSAPADFQKAVQAIQLAHAKIGTLQKIVASGQRMQLTGVG